MMRVCQSNGLHRTKAQGFTAALGHHLNRQTTIKIARGFARVKLGLFGSQKRVNKRLILSVVHWTIQIGGALGFGFAFVIARLHPCLRHIYAIMIHNWRNCIEKCQRLSAVFGLNRLPQIPRGQRPGGNDPLAGCRQVFVFTVHNRNIGMRL